MSLYRDCCCEFCGLTSILLDARFSQVYSFVCNTTGSNYTLYPNGLGTSRNLNVPGTDVTLVRSVTPGYPGGSGQLYPYFWATVPSAEPWTGYSLANCAGSCAWLAYHGARISMEKHNGASPGYWACTLTMFHRWQKPASGPCGPSGVSSFEVFATQTMFVDYALCPIGTWGEDSWVDVFGVTRTVTTGAAKIGEYCVSCSSSRNGVCSHPEASRRTGSRPSPGVCRVCPDYSGPDRGLGDTVHRIAVATGIVEAVGTCAGCARRRASLNDSIRFRREG